jgi:hypothetical protein
MAIPDRSPPRIPLFCTSDLRLCSDPDAPQPATIVAGWPPLRYCIIITSFHLEERVKHAAIYCWLILLISTWTASGPAQSISSGISGAVQDPQGLPVQGAAVEVRNEGTGSLLEFRTDQTGRFHALTLAPGEYSIIVTAPGFARFRFESVRLLVGETRRLTAVLQTETLAQEVTVTAEDISHVAIDRGGEGKTIPLKAMSDLPMLSGGQGRNFRTQVYLTPGITPSPVAHRPFISSGARSRNNNILVDSNDYNEIEGGLTLGRGLSEQTLPSESIEGMQVLTHNFKAEYGRQNGSIISLISKSGTNEWHGMFYDYLRNDALNARNTFDAVKTPFKLNQFGAHTGGPLVKDRTFIFGNYEQLEVRNSSGRTIQTLTPAQKASAAPAVQPLANLYPDPNVPGTNLFRTSVGQAGTTKSFLVRLDDNLSPRQRVFARVTYLNTLSDQVGGASLLESTRDIGNRGYSLHHIWTPSATVVNEARFNYTRFKVLDVFDDPLALGDPSRNGLAGAVTTNGLTALGHQSFLGHYNFQNNFQWTDDLSLQRGRHSIKTGVAVRRLQLNNARIGVAFIGQVRFNSVTDFLAGRAASYSRNTGNPYIGLRATEYNAYVQDDWRVRPRLTLNLGLRYELNSVPKEVNGLIAEQYRFRGDHNNFAPRFGFAWQADRDGKTAVRGGYGVYYNVLELSFVGLTRFNPPLIQNLVAANPQFPDLLAGAQAGLPSGLVIPDVNSRLPYSHHFNLTVERQLFNPRTVLSAGYVGTTGVKLPLAARPNGGDGLPQAQRPDTSVGVVNRLETAGTSRYDGLQTSLQWEGSGIWLRAAYTFSKFLDTVSDFPTSNTGIDRQLLALDENNRRLNRGISDLDITHVASLAYSYDLPFFRARAFLGGWQINGITMLQSGRPYTLYSGTDNPIGSNNNRILNVPGSLIRQGAGNRQAVLLAPGFTRQQLTPAPRTLGTIGRNTERGDALQQWNVSIAKTFTISERWRLQFRAESFNSINTVNYDLPDGVLTSANFGQAISAFDSRQTQLALRLSF